MRCPTLPLLVSLMLVSCGDGGGGGGSKRSAKKDRGEAAMSIAGTAWEASSAKATIKGKTLTIKASYMQNKDGQLNRQELHLQVKDYAGPGDYKTSPTGSRFLGVGFNTSKVKATEGNEEATTKAVTDTLKNTKHMMLIGAVVKVSSANDTEIVGTFSWQPPKGMEQPSLENGTFRALVSK